MKVPLGCAGVCHNSGHEPMAVTGDDSIMDEMMASDMNHVNENDERAELLQRRAMLEVTPSCCG